MRTVPLTLREANKFVGRLHRHHKPVRGYRFAIGAEEGTELVGVVIVGRPVARGVDWRLTAEVTRLCTDGTKNACSFLYSAAARAAAAMGHKSIQTYILVSEPGTSLKAAGWQYDGAVVGQKWSHSEARQLMINGETRLNDHPIDDKQRWIKHLA